MKLFNLFSLLSLMGLMTACSVEPVPIEYGKDACHFCKMNVVDRQHAAEIVTTKGKAFKYDAVECMMQDRKNWKEKDIALFLIADYSNPGKLVDAQKATYLVSENLPSPMGANLSGFETKEEANKTKAEKGGEILSWDDLQKKYK